MGLTITSFPALNGLVTIDGVYGKIRDLKTTKKNDNLPPNINNNDDLKYELEFRVIYEKDGKLVHNEFYRKEYEAPITSNLWDTCYTYLKEKLTEKNLAHNDVM